MKYLSFDIEATGLEEHDLIIEFAMVPFCTQTQKINEDLKKHFFIKCPSFEELKPKLNQWVIDHNKELIDKAHNEGIEIEKFKEELINYLDSDEVKDYFNNERITLFGKSMSAIDLPFMNRDLGWGFMRKYFNHRQLDLSSVAYTLIDMQHIPAECESGSKLMDFLGMGEVAHTALEDAINTALMYFKLMDIASKK
ncbi:exonuclease domain-containing protein [Bacteriovorax sp. DB6_IX]|uniref:exonuclease domain-containing protein n=1 Tax=Bacteriovorax sp. DB6_IX TaxID=1353530 RepID=UPI000389FE82|nr:exonuclease domain-containing protein [Bacteriovorax sp. DB6_IX]EQC51211.1 exonuclease [Bacteriovorax sp. DB6_IX]